MPPKEMKEEMPIEVVEDIEEMPKKKKATKKEKVEVPVETMPKKKGGGMRKMDDKEKELLKKYFSENSSDKSAQAKLRMKVMRSAKNISTMGQLKKMV